jgi:tetratricopeptide (TPR) repeat protein
MSINQFKSTKKKSGLFFFFFFSMILVSGQTKVIDSLSKRLKEVEGEEKVKTYIGLSYNFLRISPDSSFYFAGQALEYSKKSDNQRGVARSLNLMGIVKSSQGNYQEALDFHKQALEIFEQIKDTNAIGITCNNIGINYRKTGNYSEAVRYYQMASNIADQAKDNIGLCYAKNNIGNVYLDWEKF